MTKRSHKTLKRITQAYGVSNIVVHSCRFFYFIFILHAGKSSPTRAHPQRSFYASRDNFCWHTTWNLEPWRGATRAAVLLNAPQTSHGFRQMALVVPRSTYLSVVYTIGGLGACVREQNVKVINQDERRYSETVQMYVGMHVDLC